MSMAIITLCPFICSLAHSLKLPHEALIADSLGEEEGALGDEPTAGLAGAVVADQRVDVGAPGCEVLALPLAAAEVDAGEVGRGLGRHAVGLDFDHLGGQGVLRGDVLKSVFSQSS